MDMLYPDLFKSFEAVRWTWKRTSLEPIRRRAPHEDQAVTIKMNAITNGALPATEMFCATTGTIRILRAVRFDPARRSNAECCISAAKSPEPTVPVRRGMGIRNR